MLHAGSSSDLGFRCLPAATAANLGTCWKTTIVDGEGAYLG